ncbi:MAG: DUF983 domain-containing protein [Alphaproteobacteria bacterium]|nr:DUF983 domain-containing protein [Alphaproteobacteria bacterium]
MSLSAPPSLLAAALKRRCPACGEGRLYRRYLQVADRCAVCDLDLRFQDSGDGPAVFIIMIVGFIVVGLVLWTELSFAPPLWLHMLLWTPLILGLSLALLPVLKAGMVGLHYRHNILDAGKRPRH